MTLGECKAKVTSYEFSVWNAYFDWETNNAFHREDWYFAQLTAEVARKFAKHPKKIKDKDFLLKFEPPKEDAISAAVHTEQSKAAWGAILGGASKKAKGGKRHPPIMPKPAPAPAPKRVPLSRGKQKPKGK